MAQPTRAQTKFDLQRAGTSRLRGYPVAAPGTATCSGRGTDSVPGNTSPSTIQSEEQATATIASAQDNLDLTAIGDREQAYAALMSIAVYLQRIEPHSPTPYLIRRAVELGQLSLPDMIRDVSASAGSLDKFFELLGITPPG